MIRQVKTYLALVGVTDAIQDKVAIYEKVVQARDAVEAASKVKLGKREYVSEVRLDPAQPRVITQGLTAAPAIDASPGAAPLSLKELAAIADGGTEVDPGFATAVALVDPESFPEEFEDEAFKHPPAGPLDALDIEAFRVQ